MRNLESSYFLQSLMPTLSEINPLWYVHVNGRDYLFTICNRRLLSDLWPLLNLSMKWTLQCGKGESWKAIWEWWFLLISFVLWGVNWSKNLHKWRNKLLDDYFDICMPKFPYFDVYIIYNSVGRLLISYSNHHISLSLYAHWIQKRAISLSGRAGMELWRISLRRPRHSCRLSSFFHPPTHAGW